MPEFKQPINIPIDDQYYRLIEDYTYEWHLKKGDRVSAFRINVPSGFVYDGASVPRIAWTLTGIRPDGAIRGAALIHDWIYQYKGHLPAGSHQFQDENGEWQQVVAVWKRKAADKLFGRLMREGGVSSTRRKLAYLAVRAFGGGYWNS